MSSEAILDVRDLTVSLNSESRPIDLVESVTFSVRAGETIGLVGESGSGKTLTALALMGLLPSDVMRIRKGSVRLAGRELVGLPERAMEDVRGREVGMIFQDPMSSLDPCFTVGDQIGEVLRRHRRLTRRQAAAAAAELLDLVRIPGASRRVNDYPHTFSGGMRQRVMIAIAIACEPKLLIADEPTTALDVTVQAQILELLSELRETTGAAMILVSHDLAVISSVCDRLAIMYAGQVIERGIRAAVFSRPVHPYTAALIASSSMRTRGQPLASIPGTVPLPADFPETCRFLPRCGYAVSGLCDIAKPELLPAPSGTDARCHRRNELALQGVL